jgi:hypothetical protein
MSDNKPHMDHETLLAAVDKRFDRLEEKLDKYAVQTTKNTNDISWIRGSLKLSVSAIITLLGSALAYIFGAK